VDTTREGLETKLSTSRSSAFVSFIKFRSCPVVALVHIPLLQTNQGDHTCHWFEMEDYTRDFNNCYLKRRLDMWKLSTYWSGCEYGDRVEMLALIQMLESEQ
jgi:hypothetical protein